MVLGRILIPQKFLNLTGQPKLDCTKTNSIQIYVQKLAHQDLAGQHYVPKLDGTQTNIIHENNGIYGKFLAHNLHTKRRCTN